MVPSSRSKGTRTSEDCGQAQNPGTLARKMAILTRNPLKGRHRACTYEDGSPGPPRDTYKGEELSCCPAKYRELLLGDPSLLVEGIQLPLHSGEEEEEDGSQVGSDAAPGTPRHSTSFATYRDIIPMFCSCLQPQMASEKAPNGR